MDLQKALTLLEVEYSPNWTKIEAQIKPDLKLIHPDAYRNLHIIYNRPDDTESSYMLEETSPELRQQFLSNIGADYLTGLAQTIPYLSCDNLWVDLTKMGIDIKYSKEAVIHQSQGIINGVKELRDQYLPENLNAEIITAPSMWALRYAANTVSSRISSWWNNTDEVIAEENIQQSLADQGVLTSHAQIDKLLALEEEPTPSLAQNIAAPLAIQPPTPPNSPSKAISKPIPPSSLATEQTDEQLPNTSLAL